MDALTRCDEVGCKSQRERKKGEGEIGKWRLGKVMGKREGPGLVFYRPPGYLMSLPGYL